MLEHQYHILLPAELARTHWRETGDFANPYPTGTEQYREYEEQAWKISLDFEWRHYDQPDGE